jgi:ribosomal protein S18 acetylase RimI-like enzyme
MSNNNDAIRVLEADDFERVAEIYNLTHMAEYAGESHPFPPQHLADSPSLLELFHKSEVFVFDDEQIKGFIGHQGPNIIWLYVHPEHQGAGIGGLLIDFLLRQLNGIAVISVVKTNHSALRLYQQRGFRVNGEYAFDYQGQSVEALMLVAGF